MLELAVDGAGQFVRGAILVHEPRHLTGMAHAVGGELRRNDAVDGTAVALAELEEPPRGSVREELLARVPFERHADQLGFEPALPQLGGQLPNQRFGAASHEGHLRFADDDAARKHFEPRMVPRRIFCPT